ncbi:MAG: hypothetical protein V4574_01355 [Pseudomonadota bacterium]
MIAGAADSVDLTPRSMVPLAGFGNRRGAAESVADPLEANAVALRDESGRTAVIVTFDALFVGPVVDAALRTVLVQLGIRDEDILLLASHTHYAPSLDPGKPRLGAADGAYIAWVIEQTTAMLRRLLAKPFVPLTLSHSEAKWDGAIHRRKRWPLPYFNGGKFGRHEPAMAPEPAGPRDERVRTWQLHSDGKPFAILWSCACHPTGFPHQNRVSAEYPGHVRAAIRAELGDLPVLFLQGFAGDIRQRSPETRPAFRRIARTLRYGPSFCAFDEAGWTRWTGTLSGTVRSTLKRAAPATLSGPIRSALTATPVSALLDAGNPGKQVEFRRLAIGDGLDFWAVSAEPSVALRNHLPAGTIALGYLGDVFGYWPTAAQAAEGGYEGRGFIDAFGLEGRFRPLIDTIFKDMVERLRADRR